MRAMANGVAVAFAMAAVLIVGPARAQATAAGALLTAEQVQAKQAAEDRRLDALQATLQPRYGDIALPEAKARLHLGIDYFFLVHLSYTLKKIGLSKFVEDIRNR